MLKSSAKLTDSSLVGIITPGLQDWGCGQSLGRLPAAKSKLVEGRQKNKAIAPWLPPLLINKSIVTNRQNIKKCPLSIY